MAEETDRERTRRIVLGQMSLWAVAALTPEERLEEYINLVYEAREEVRAEYAKAAPSTYQPKFTKKQRKQLVSCIAGGSDEGADALDAVLDDWDHAYGKGS